MNESPSMQAVSLQSSRAQEARLAARIGSLGFRILVSLALVGSVAAGVLWFLHDIRPAAFSAAVALACLMPAVWYKKQLSVLPPDGNTISERLSGDVLRLLPPALNLTPRTVWHAMRDNWQTIFFTNHLLLDPDTVEHLLGDDAAAMPAIWQEAERLSRLGTNPYVEVSHIVTAIMGTSPQLGEYLTHVKLSSADIYKVSAWLERVLEGVRAPKPYFGGIGRDWSHGFTPELNQYGHNISLAIEQSGATFESLTNSPGVQAIKTAFAQGSTSVALIGEDGVGKTSHVYALAQLLLEEKNDRNLEHRQIISLSPSAIVSVAKRPGDLEQIVIGLLGEAVHAGHIVLFLDDAQLFFSSGPGAFDMTQILLPVLQSRSVQIILAMTPHDYQSLKAQNMAFANVLTPVQLQEPPEEEVLRIMEDTALNLEHKHKNLITYEAVREAYALSGRYDQDVAYPGRAIRLMEHSLSYALPGGVVTIESVQQAIEQTRGVKVGTAAPAEADTLLNLEDRIHERMINQSQAVSVVANALRRARAGVANPKRPIGSFLFLGPTGVGKTELAKAVAATYFNAESSMVRLDMSEYQQPEDVQRLLSDGAAESKSLIMAVRQQPFAVVLLDEIEKAHPNILNLLLQLLDEGQLTDNSGRAVSFKDCVIIATSNAGANTIRERIANGDSVETLQEDLTNELINSGQFKPELLNRFDEVVIFRPLNQEELAQVVGLMLAEINKTLSAQNISVQLTPAAIAKIVETGYDARLGARPMRRALQKSVENTIAGRILKGEVRPGDSVVLDAADLVGSTVAV